MTEMHFLSIKQCLIVLNKNQVLFLQEDLFIVLFNLIIRI